jgi:hypothetical protein
MTKINGNTLSEKASELIKKFAETTGLGDDARVVEESVFTIFELLKLARQRSKTEPDIPAEQFIGIIGTFERFGKVEFEY